MTNLLRYAVFYFKLSLVVFILFLLLDFDDLDNFDDFLRLPLEDVVFCLAFVDYSAACLTSE